VGGFEIGFLAGAMLEAAARRIPVVLDGFITGAAALVAWSLEPGVKDYFLASHQSRESGHRHLLERLGLRPYLNLDLRLGEGSGAALFLPLVDTASAILREMATFESAGVSDKG
jgi:nicotinate-nucleotide--dimethylbenzimidazole phosphoribosyltransferase